MNGDGNPREHSKEGELNDQRENHDGVAGGDQARVLAGQHAARRREDEEANHIAKDEKPRNLIVLQRGTAERQRNGLARGADKLGNDEIVDEGEEDRPNQQREHRDDVRENGGRLLQRCEVKRRVSCVQKRWKSSPK